MVVATACNFVVKVSAGTIKPVKTDQSLSSNRTFSKNIF